MAQLVEQRIRNAWVAGSSPASGSLSWYPLGTSFFCITEQRAKALVEQASASGTRLGASGTPASLLRPMYCLLAGRDRSLY